MLPRTASHRLRRPPPGQQSGLILPATLALHLPPQLGPALSGPQAEPTPATRYDAHLPETGGDCIETPMCCAPAQPRVLTLGTFLRSFRWGHVRQPGESRVAGHGLEGRRWTRRRTIHHRSDSTICETYGLAKEGARHHGYTGARGYHPCLVLRLTGPTPPAAPPTSCVKRWGGFATEGPAGSSLCGPTAASIPTPWSPSAAGNHHPPAQKPAQSHRGDTRRCLDADSDGRCCGRDHLHALPE